MENKFVYFDHQFYKLESIIEKEIDLFFNTCMLSAYQLSVRITEDVNILCEGLFEKNVVSTKEMDQLIAKINDRICDELQINKKYLAMEISNAKEVYFIDNCNNLIMNKGKEHKATQFTAHIAENVINNSFSHILGKCSSSSIIDFISGYAGAGKWVLGKNHKSVISSKFQKNIYQYMKGMLINLKTKMKNELVMEWEYYFEMQEESIAI